MNYGEKKPDFSTAKEFLKQVEDVDVSIISDYHDGEYGSLITMPDGDQVGCGPSELHEKGADHEAYAVAKAFKLLAEYKESHPEEYKRIGPQAWVRKSWWEINNPQEERL